MGTYGQLREVEHQLIKDFREATIPVSKLAKKYGVSRQSIYVFIERKGIKRPERGHSKQCSICRGLIRIGGLSLKSIRSQVGMSLPPFSPMTQMNEVRVSDGKGGGRYGH